jgi:histone-lysine N-methyltransferase SETMAR
LLQRTNELIGKDRRIIKRKLASELSVSKGSVNNIIDALGCAKVCTFWVPSSLNDDHKLFRKRCVQICSPVSYEAEGESVLSRIVIVDKTWIHHFEPETINSQWNGVIRLLLGGRSSWPLFSWDAEAVILVNIMPRGQTINLDLHIQTLTNFQKRLRRVRSHKNVDEILHHDNARPHTSLKTQKAIIKLGWTVLCHPRYNPDLALSDFHLFETLKDTIRGKRFGSNDEVMEEMAGSAGFKLVQDGNTYSCFSLAKGC